MEKQRKNSFEQVSRQVERVRKIYSGIGEPLPVDVIIDLYRHLGTALEPAQADARPQKKRRTQA